MVTTQVYIDTSVIGGCIDQEFREWSIKLFDEFKNGNKIAVISDITLDELELAPKKVQDIIKRYEPQSKLWTLKTGQAPRN